MRVLSPRGRAAAARRRAPRVDESSQMVRLEPRPGRRRTRAACRARPTSWPRNPQRSCRVGGRHVVFAPVAGPPSVSDLQRGKRTGSIADFRDFVRLSQAFDVIHVLGQMTEPQDVAGAGASPGDLAGATHPRRQGAVLLLPRRWPAAPTVSRCCASRTASTRRPSRPSRAATASATPTRPCSSTCR